MAPSLERFNEIFRDQYPVLVREIYIMLGDWAAAEDAAQEAFFRLLRNWRKVSRYERPGAWTRRVAIRVARRAAGKSFLVSLAEERFAANPNPGVIAVDVDLLRAILALPFHQRAALALRSLGGLPHADVAKALNCSEATARVHFHRARQRLSALLEMEVQDDE